MQLTGKACSFDSCFSKCYCELSKSFDGLMWKAHAALAQSSRNTMERYKYIRLVIRIFLRLLIPLRDKILSLDELKRCDSVPQHYALNSGSFTYLLFGCKTSCVLSVPYCPKLNTNCSISIAQKTKIKLSFDLFKLWRSQHSTFQFSLMESWISSSEETVNKWLKTKTS